MKNKNKIKITPNDNSIAYTCKKVLEPYYKIVEKDEDYVLNITDKWDKLLTELYFSKKEYYSNPKENKLCIKKPIFGSSSKGLSLEIFNSQKIQKGYIYQNYIEGQEYTIDCWIFNYKLKNFAVRERHNIWNGISMKSIFTNKYNKKIKSILIDIFSRLNWIDGIYTIQFIRDKKNKFWLIEINRRPCTNMCYGGESNFILNYVRANLGEKYYINKIKCKNIQRFLGWIIK